MTVEDAVRLGLELARTIARGDPHDDLLADGARTLLRADAGVGIASWDFPPGRPARVRVDACDAPPMTPTQEAAGIDATSTHPSFAVMLRGRAPIAHRTSDVVRMREFWRTEAYEAVHGYFGGRFPAAVVLRRTDTRLVFLGVHRQAADFSHADVELLEVLGEPVRAALDFREALDRTTARLASGARPVDRGFTPREADVLALVAAGWTDAHIARRLGISEATVRQRLATARDRVGAVNRTQVVVRWLEATGRLRGTDPPPGR